MKPYRMSLILVAVIIITGVVSADMRTDHQPVPLPVSPRESPSRPIDDCSIVYYNICSGWVWLWGPAGVNEIGVVFDLPADCGMEPGEEYTNTGFGWYWRYTIPGYYYTVDYNLWNLDDSWCKVGIAVGSLAGQDPNACIDWPGPGTGHSFIFGNYNIEYCPPYDLFHDPLGPTQLLMDASFSTDVTSIKPASWGAVKSLFR